MLPRTILSVTFRSDQALADPTLADAARRALASSADPKSLRELLGQTKSAAARLAVGQALVDIEKGATQEVILAQLAGDPAGDLEGKLWALDDLVKSKTRDSAYVPGLVQLLLIPIHRRGASG
jgi:hypothetical protein